MARTQQKVSEWEQRNKKNILSRRPLRSNKYHKKSVNGLTKDCSLTLCDLLLNFNISMSKKYLSIILINLTQQH